MPNLFEMECRRCLICTVPITMSQLGIDACRACAAFFKRSQLAGRAFVCRQSGGQCTFRKHARFMCRSCRYDRCVELGMVYPKKRKQRRMETEEAEDMAVNTEDMQASASSVSPTSSCDDPILDRIKAEYNSSYIRRVEQERPLVAQHKLTRIDNSNLELYNVSVAAYYDDIFRVTVKEMMALLRSVFDEFGYLSILHRTTIFNNFIGKFRMIECVYLSARYFSNPFNFMTSLLTFVDFRNMPGWVSEEENIERKEDFVMSLNNFAQDYYDLLIPTLRMDELTEREFHALIAYVYCDVDSLDVPEHIIRDTNNMKTKIFAELQDHYRNELKLVDFSKRLGNLMTIAHSAGEAGILMNEEMRMYSAVFGIFSEECFRELFME